MSDSSGLSPGLSEFSAGTSHGAPADSRGNSGSGDHSVLADAEALIEDLKTYAEAEIGYQKSRVVFTARRINWAFFYGAAAFGLLHLALIALVVGIVLALNPLIGPWLSILMVVGLLLAGAFFFIQRLRARLADIRSVFEQGHP